MTMDWIQLLSPVRQGQKSVNTAFSRSAFEQDYDRIIFSHPFRRLQDKTQVHPLPEHDFVHTRLTHSLEVSSVGRSLGRKAGEVLIQRHQQLTSAYNLFDFGAITAAASLAHDLGNPPFGHAGEDALSDYFSLTESGRALQPLVTPEQWQDLIQFEGNAQGFRIINSNTYGLQLTHATLGAFTKYPCASTLSNRDKSRKSQKKFGFFQTEKELFTETATHLGLRPTDNGAWCRHPLALLVEAADDICYNIIDLEDGCRLGLVSFNDTVELLAGILKDDYSREKLERIHSQNEKIGVLRAMAIGRLVTECTEVFLDHEPEIMSGQFDKALIDESTSRTILEQISRTSFRQIYRSRNVLEIEASGHEVLPGILHEFVTAGRFIIGTANSQKKTPRKYQNIGLLFPDEVQYALSQTTDFYEMLRLVLDFVSGLTDKHALSIFRKIKGISI